MEIIKHGTFNNIITCHCGCKFKYNPDDIVFAYNPYESSTSKIKNNLYVCCPECNARHYVGTVNKVPQKNIKEYHFDSYEKDKT